jgi:hypothetical protein
MIGNEPEPLLKARQPEGNGPKRPLHKKGWAAEAALEGKECASSRYEVVVVGLAR